jgi:SAM-dependent methyltransferase
VNGNHEVSPDFIRATYTSSPTDPPKSSLYGKEFTTGKMAREYEDVVERIYSPKAQFLANFLKSQGIAVEGTSVLDVGCGSGHFVSALLKHGFSSAQGFDSFAPAIEAAQKIGNLNSRQVSVEAPENLMSILADSEASVVSMMCVLVHLESPTEALKAMRRNPKTKFTYQKIPVWSFATMLEAAFPGFRARVLGSDHSNIFSHESLLWIEKELGMKRVASWTFGGDWLDLQRRILLGMERSGASNELVNRANSRLSATSNEMQELLDRSHMASEIHLIWEFN